MPLKLRMPPRFWSYLWKAVIGLMVIGMTLLIYSTLVGAP